MQIAQPAAGQERPGGLNQVLSYLRHSAENRAVGIPQRIPDTSGSVAPLPRQVAVFSPETRLAALWHLCRLGFILRFWSGATEHAEFARGQRGRGNLYSWSFFFFCDAGGIPAVSMPSSLHPHQKP